MTWVSDIKKLMKEIPSENVIGGLKLDQVNQMKSVNKTIRKYRRFEILEERQRRMRRRYDFRSVIQYIRQLSSKSANQSKGKFGDKRKNKIQIGTGLNRITKILNSKSSKSGKSRPIIIVPNEVIKGNLNMTNAKQFLINKTFMEVVEITKNSQKNPKRKDVLYVNIQDKRIICDIFSHSLDGANFSFEIWDDLRFVKQKKRIDSVVAIFIKVNI
jgi:hypothetical protein